MAVRPIDGDAVKRRAWDIAEAWKDQGRDYEALLLESVVEQIVDTAPTLTPPKEATYPCDLCVYNPPSSLDGKPCTCCPATGRPPEGEEDT